MAARTKPSAKKGKQSTARTKQQELEILQQSIINCKKAGIPMGIKREYADGGNGLTLKFGDGVDYQNNSLIWVG